MPQIGPYTLHAVHAGRFALDGGAMFGIVPKPLWAQRIAPDEQNRIPLATRCLLLRSDERCVLVDTGIGDVFGEKYRSIYAVEGTDVVAGLAAHGVEPSDVTDVILTHLHFDHCGGATRAACEERVPTFPNATYHVQRAHWTWARNAHPKEKNSFLRRTFDPLAAAGQLHLVDGATTLFPGLSVRTVDGHTEAQQLVVVHDDAQTLVYVADLLPTTHHVGAAWTMAYDVHPLTTIDEKADFLRQAAKAEWNLFFEHDPEVEVARAVSTADGPALADKRTLDAL
ncbi:MBL fold metallo-hydrolase [Salisaeta longa]|uniref:MBL fold metallo-hydrolase n=1 Tax=Salisaeta longa TaxID=503170 RepID=UPI0003B55E17|nr:MBL fold metallo-hydrolase [Salisaeta longa]